MVDKATPSTTEVDRLGGQQYTISGGVNIGIISGQVSDTFTPPKSAAKAVKIGLCSIEWYSAITTGSTGEVGGYSDYFIAVVQVTKNAYPSLTVHIEGNFFLPFHFDTDRVKQSFTNQFSSPPMTTIDSNPRGVGFIQLDGQNITTQYQAVWSVGEHHTISAATRVKTDSGVSYVFNSWSDNGPQQHTIIAPTTPTTFVATYQESGFSSTSVTAASTVTKGDFTDAFWMLGITIGVLFVIGLSIYVLVRFASKRTYGRSS